MANLNRFINTLPRNFNPELNRVLYALLYAVALSDDDVEASILEAKKQLFVRTATGRNLEKLAKSLGVAKPATLGLSDTEFQELIPNLSLKPKTIRKAFYDTADIFWGPLFSRANVTSQNSGPFNVSAGDIFKLKVNAGTVQSVKVLTGEIETNGAATADEIVTILSKLSGITVSIIEDPVSNDQFINIRTNTPGATGSVEVVTSSMVGSSKLDFTLGEFDILKLDQRVCIYNINPNELLIEIPAIVPALRRTLKGSHHFHQDSTIESPEPPNNGIWQGSFLFNPTGSVATFTITKQRCDLQQDLNKGQIYTSIAVDDTSLFENPSGEVIFGFGTDVQEGPVKYRGIPNSNTILLDPSYTFRNDHETGSVLNVISKREPYTPAKSGKDLAVYLTSPSGAREVVQDILEGLAAAGIIITFRILSPTYKYILDNPYISTDDAPSDE